jgi:rare lipoprotein A
MRGALVLMLACIAGGAAMAAPAVSGRVSWYGGKRHEGRAMANGCPFREALFTAAHRSLPFGSVLRVTDLRTGRTLDVPITDRGPYIDGRVLDLSRAAFARLDDLAAGVVVMQLEVITARPGVVARCRPR